MAGDIFEMEEKKSGIKFVFIEYHYILLVLILAEGDCFVIFFIQSTADIANSYECSNQIF